MLRPLLFGLAFLLLQACSDSTDSFNSNPTPPSGPTYSARLSGPSTAFPTLPRMAGRACATATPSPSTIIAWS